MNLRHPKNNKLLSSYERARLVAFITCLSAFLYHTGVFFVFMVFKIFPMMILNVFSIVLFLGILLLIPKQKSYVFLYFIASVEVVIFQFMMGFFLGSEIGYHFFILLMGLLPFLVFEYRFKIATLFTVATSFTFIAFDNIHMSAKYLLPSVAVRTFKVVNVSVSVAIIILMVLIYTHIVYKIELQLKHQNHNLENEIRLAAFIQQNFYKQENIEFLNWDIAYYNRPLAGVSGDLYDFYKNGDKLDGVGIFDVSGHGISSGLVTMLVKNIIHQEFYKEEELELWEVVNKINDRVISEKGKIQNYLTGILVRINNFRLELVNAGHPYPVVYRHSTGSCQYLEKAEDFSGGAIGISGFPAYFYSQFLDLENGDEIVLYTDGISDTLNSRNERFGSSEFLKVIKENVHLSAAEQIKAIRGKLKEFRKDSELTDDMTIIILKRKDLLDI